MNFVIVLTANVLIAFLMGKWSFHNLNQFHDKCFITFHRKYGYQITLFPVLFRNVKIHNS